MELGLKDKIAFVTGTGSQAGIVTLRHPATPFRLNGNGTRYKYA